MANPVLFRSSLWLGFFHTLAILMWQTWQVDAYLTGVYIVGVFTSLLNHGLTSELYKWGDRAWMALGGASDLTYIILYCTHTLERWLLLLLLCSYAGAFFLAKWHVRAVGKKQAGNYPHLFTHASATVVHVWLLYQSASGMAATAVMGYRLVI